MNEGIHYVGWFMFIGMVALLIGFVWCMLNPVRRRKQLGVGAVPMFFTYLAIMLIALNIALGDRGKYSYLILGFCFLFLILSVWKLLPIKCERFRIRRAVKYPTARNSSPKIARNAIMTRLCP